MRVQESGDGHEATMVLCLTERNETEVVAIVDPVFGLRKREERRGEE